MTVVEHEGRLYPLGRTLTPTHDPANRRFPAMLGQVRRRRHVRYGGPFDQGSIGSCTGNALAGWFNTQNGGHRTGDPLKSEADAVRYYSLGTGLDSWPGTYPPDDTGCDGESVCKAARAAGDLTSYHHAFGVDHMLGALMVTPVIVGTVWSVGMFTPDENGVVTPSGNVVGGHEYEAVGYDPATGLIEFWQSWGLTWGRRGRFFIHRDPFSELLQQQGDVTVPVR